MRRPAAPRLLVCPLPGARRQFVQMTLLFVTTMMPGERVTGSEVVSATFIEAMRRAGNRVVVIAYRRVGSRLEGGPDEVRIADRHIETRGPRCAPIGGWPGASQPGSRTRRQNTSPGAFAGRLPHDQRPAAGSDRRRPCADGLGRSRERRVPVAYLAHNVEHQLYREAAERSRWPMSSVNRREAKAIESVERAIVRRAAQVWVLSDKDADSLQALDRAPRRESSRCHPRCPRSASPRAATTLPPSAAGPGRKRRRPALVPGPGRAAPGPPGQGRSRRSRRGAAHLRPLQRDLRGPCAGCRAVPRQESRGCSPLHRRRRGPDQVGRCDRDRHAGRRHSLGATGNHAPPTTVRVAGDPESFAAAVSDRLQEPLSATDRGSAAAWTRARREAFQGAIAIALASSQPEPMPA